MAIIKSLLTAKPKMKTEIVDAPELGEGAQILLREFSADSGSDFNFELMKNEKFESASGNSKNSIRSPMRFYALLICCSAVDEAGNQISDSSQADALMQSWPRELILRVGEVAAKINGFTAQAKDEAKKDSPLSQQPQ